jgi:hypothetical protein
MLTQRRKRLIKQLHYTHTATRDLAVTCICPLSRTIIGQGSFVYSEVLDERGIHYGKEDKSRIERRSYSLLFRYNQHILHFHQSFNPTTTLWYQHLPCPIREITRVSRTTSIALHCSRMRTVRCTLMMETYCSLQMILLRAMNSNAVSKSKKTSSLEQVIFDMGSLYEARSSLPPKVLVLKSERVHTPMQKYKEFPGTCKVHFLQKTCQSLCWT